MQSMASSRQKTIMQSSRESETRPCHQQDRITPPLRNLIMEEIKFLTPGHQVTMHLEPPIFGFSQTSQTIIWTGPISFCIGIGIFLIKFFHSQSHLDICFSEDLAQHTYFIIFFQMFIEKYWNAAVQNINSRREGFVSLLVSGAGLTCIGTQQRGIQ